MARAFRTLLVWLIMLTLPVQMVSASIMALRMDMPAQQHSQMLVSPDCHGEMAAANTDPEQPASPQPIKAKACNSCCTGALLDSVSLPHGLLPEPSTRYGADYTQPRKGHIPDGLERPPKHIS